MNEYERKKFVNRVAKELTYFICHPEDALTKLEQKIQRTNDKNEKKVLTDKINFYLNWLEKNEPIVFIFRNLNATSTVNEQTKILIKYKQIMR